MEGYINITIQPPMSQLQERPADTDDPNTWYHSWEANNLTMIQLSIGIAMRRQLHGADLGHKCVVLELGPVMTQRKFELIWNILVFPDFYKILLLPLDVNWTVNQTGKDKKQCTMKKYSFNIQW